MQPNLNPQDAESLAVEDTPIDGPEQRAVEDTPVPDIPKSLYSEETNKFFAVQAAFMDSYLNGTPVRENLGKYYREPDASVSARKLAEDKVAADKTAVQENLLEDPYGESGDVSQEVSLTQSVTEDLDNNKADIDLQFTESALGGEGTLEQAKLEAGRIKMRKMLSGWQEEVGTGDHVMELGKMFFTPFLESARGGKVTGEYFGAKEEFQGMIRAFQDYPVEDQVAMLPSLKKELEEKVGNVDAINLLSSFLDPMSDTDFDRWGGGEVVWDVLDATGVGYGIGLALKGVKGSVNTVKTLQALRNHEAAEEAATAAVLDPDIAESLGMDSMAAVSTALPYDTSMEVIGAAGGLSNKVSKNLGKFFEEADATSNSIIKGHGFLKESVVSNKYRKDLEDAAMKKFKAEEAENIRIVNRDRNGTEFEYQVLDDSGNLTDQTYRLTLSMDNAGHFEQETTGIIREFIGSPSVFAKGMLREDVRTAERVDYLTARINKQLTDLTKKALKPIGLMPTPKTKESLARVDKALIEGDEWKNTDGTRGTIFTPDELRTKFGFKDENEISAYYRVNRLYNNLWHIRNNEKRDELTTLNYRGFKVTDADGPQIGKTYSNAVTARATLNNNGVTQVYDAELDEVVDLASSSSEYIAEAYADGKSLVRMDTPYDVGEGRLFKHALINTSDITDLPAEVLYRKTGYVPRIYEDATHFVKERVARVVDGNKEVKTNNTLRFFDNPKDAENYRQGLIKAEVASKMDDVMKRDLSPEALAKAEKSAVEEAEEKYIKLTDREEEALAASVGEVSHGSAGLYTGGRAQDDILFGLEGDRAQRVNSFDSLIRNVSNISRYTAINQWRLGLEQRWINTANEIFKSKGQDFRVESFKRLDRDSETSPEVRFLNRSYDQIRDWQNFPTSSEQFFSNVMRGLYDFTSSRDMKKTSRMLGNFRDSDPVSAARATAFHSLLGMLNPSHMWIQAQGAATSISLGFGKYLTQTLRNTSGLTMLGYGAKDSKRYALVAKANLMDKKELESMHNLWLKTGYEDSVLQTADHAAASKGYGMSMSILKSVADRGLMFYRQGELFNRRMAFTTALERWKETNKVKSVAKVSDSQLKDIMDDANNIMLNMTKNNAAPWQKGLPSLPFQFLQVTSKSVETMTGLNGNFSRVERGKLMLGQLALYGTAGIPLVSLPYMLATEVFGMTQEDIENNPTTFKAINDGFWGVTTMHILGAEVEMSSRGSLLKGISDFVDNWFLQESGLTEKALGAFGASGVRFWDEFSRRIRPFSLASMEEIDFSDVAGLAVAPVFKTLSSYNNVQKAFMMDRLDAAFSRSGTVVAEGFNVREAFMQAMGFSPTKVDETYDLMARVRWLDKLPEQITSDILIQMNSFAAAHPEGDYTEEEWKDHKNHISVLYGTLDPDQRKRVMETVGRSFQKESLRDTYKNRYIERMKETTATDMSLWMQTLIGSKALRLGINTEEE